MVDKSNVVYVVESTHNGIQDWRVLFGFFSRAQAEFEIRHLDAADATESRRIVEYVPREEPPIAVQPETAAVILQVNLARIERLEKLLCSLARSLYDSNVGAGMNRRDLQALRRLYDAEDLPGAVAELSK